MLSNNNNNNNDKYALADLNNNYLHRVVVEVDREKSETAASRHTVLTRFDSTVDESRPAGAACELSMELIASTKSRSYKNVYQEAFCMDPDDPRRENHFFLSNVPVRVQIVGHEEEPSLVLLHTNFYIINISHCGYQWTVKRRYKNFLKLYETFTLFKTKQNIKDLAQSAHFGHQQHASTSSDTDSNHETSTGLQLNDNSIRQSSFRPSDHFKLLFQSIGSDFNQARSILEKFLKEVVEHKTFRNHNETLKFLEVSHLSFIADLGDKNKEGLIKKPTYTLSCFCIFNYSFFWDSHWLCLKDTWVGCVDPKLGRIKSVLLVDQSFRVLHGVENTGVRHGLLIENGGSTKPILVKCYNEKRALEWRLAILQMAFSTSEKFFNSQRHASFAPIRSDTLCKWFVDGSDYMESVADSIDSAREEIFITGFFLTPELYLKRPVIMGDRWRLDKLLQRKAEEGVKIYILLYKEIEMTLSINSAYSKRVLALSHKNIKVLRHPDHISEPNKLSTIMWAHHEKIVIIDQSVAYFGGLDLSYGRWDNHLHKLTDLGSVLPSNHSHSTITSHFNKKSSHTITSLETISSQSDMINVESVEISNSKREDQYLSQPVRLVAFQRINYDTMGELTVSSPSRTAHSLEAPTIYAKKQPSTSANRQARTIRMLSSPSCSIDTNPETKEDLSPTKLESDTDEESDYKPMMTKLKDSSSGIGSSLGGLKRSKSLDISRASREYNDSVITSNNNNKWRALKDNIIKNYKTMSNGSNLNTTTAQNLRLFREYGEMSIMNKLKKIKQFKDNLKKYKLRLQLDGGDNISELNSSFEAEQRDMFDLNRFRIRRNESVKKKQPMTTATSKLQEEIGVAEASESEQFLNSLQGSSKYWIGKDYCNFIYKDIREVQTPFRDFIDRQQVPRLPWHDVGGCVCGPAARDVARHFIQRWNYIKSKKVPNNPNYSLLVPKSYKNYHIPAHLESRTDHSDSSALHTCQVQVVRSVSNWSVGVNRTEASIHEAMRSLINTSKHYVYIENQFFVSMCQQQDSMSGGDVDQPTAVYNQISNCLYERIVRAHRDKEAFKVYIVMPLIPGYEGEYGKSSGVLLHAITHYNNSSFSSLFRRLAESSIEPLNYICVFGLRTWSELNNRLVTELVYVHSKLMIVDDRACIIGSANVNDRSLLGNRDSELALLIEDTEFMPGVLNKQQVEVGKYCSSLRKRLFRELLGEMSCGASKTANTGLHCSPDELPGATVDVDDPCSDEFYKQILLRYAAQNTKIYDIVFKVIPSDLVSNFQQLKEYQRMSCLSQTSLTEARIELSKIRGYLVLYPTRFLCFEDLLPPLGSKEKLLPSSLFT